MFYLLECVICIKVVKAEIVNYNFKSHDFGEWSSLVNFDRKFGPKQCKHNMRVVKTYLNYYSTIQYCNVSGCYKIYD